MIYVVEDGLTVRNYVHTAIYFKQTKGTYPHELAKGPALAPATFLTNILSLSNPDRQRLFDLYDNAEELFNDFKAQNFPDPAISLDLLKQVKG